jgi:hypothetical protein
MSRAYRQTPAEIQQALDNALHPDAELKKSDPHLNAVKQNKNRHQK